MVWVTNKSDEFLNLQWGEKNYSFSPNRSTEIPDELAPIFFGHGLEDKFPTLVRLGWTRMATDVPQALVRLGKFVISETQPQTYHTTSPVVERVPPLASRREGGKVQK